MVTIAILALFQILVSYLFFVQKMIYMVIFKKNTLFLMVIAVYVYFFQLTSEVGNFCLGTIAPYAEEFCIFSNLSSSTYQTRQKMKHKLISGQQIIST